MNTMPLCSTQIAFCSKEEMEKRLTELAAATAVLILDDASEERWGLGGMLHAMQQRMKLTRIRANVANPTQKDIADALAQLPGVPDVIIAFGGGSAIDLAKGMSAFAAGSERTLDELLLAIQQKTYRGRCFVPILAVPSTAGTGSELTQWATVWDAGKGGKYSIDDPGLKPKVALIVPELTLTLPVRLTLSTGLDALAHAMESYWSRHTGPLVQDLAHRAIELVVRNLPLVLQNPQDLQLREAMCRASVLAGLAFSQTRTTACHSISYPMTMLYGVPHGLAAAMTLAQVAEKNRGHFENDGELFAVFAPYGGIQHWLDTVCGGVVSLRLSGFGIAPDQIETLAEHSFTGGRMDNNPVDLTGEDVRTILCAVQ